MKTTSEIKEWMDEKSWIGAGSGGITKEWTIKEWSIKEFI